MAAAVLLLAGLAGAQPAAAERDAIVYKVKAAMLHHFMRYVQWPAESFFTKDADIVIGVVGRDPFGDLLEKSIQKGQYHGRKVQIQRFRTPEEIMPCHLLFVSTSESSRLREVLQVVQGLNVLTVGEADGFAERGGMIQFVVDGGNVRFEINNRAAREEGLTFSSRVLALATRVHQ
ncbi:MAG: YfiR family protein [Proteobacteria bacterium]|nr:YfiR family protein [Pseudomonadota bacterium]